VETTLTVFLSAMLSNDTDICMVAGRDEPGPPLLVSHRRRTVQINPLRLQTHARTHAMVMSLSYAQTHDVTMTTTLSLSWGRGGGGGGGGALRGRLGFFDRYPGVLITDEDEDYPAFAMAFCSAQSQRTPLAECTA